jgi:hypothetical protein
MRCYAIELALRYYYKYQKKPNVIQMILNYLIKDPLKPKAFRRIANVSIDELEGEWERIQQDAKEMKLWAEKYEKYIDKAKKGNYTAIDHEEIPGPQKSDICNQYGGCPYQTICTGRETVHQYFKRVDQILHPKIKEKNAMGSIFQERLKQIQESKGVKVFGVNLEDKKADKKEDKKEEFVPAPPPWTNVECKKCKDHPGLDEHGEACPICFKLAKQAGLPLPPECVYDPKTNTWSVYKETPDTEAIPVMGQDGQLKEAKDKPISTPQAAAKQESKAVRKLKSDSLSKAVEKQQPQPVEESVEVSEVQQVEKKGQVKGGKQLGRPPMGYTLCIGTVPLRHGTKEVLYAEQLLDKAKEMISAELKQDYENQDPFQRRDMVSLAVRSMASSFGSAIIVAPDSHCLTPDLRVVIEELKVNAQIIFVAAGY